MAKYTVYEGRMDYEKNMQTTEAGSLLVNTPDWLMNDESQNAVVQSSSRTIVSGRNIDSHTGL